MSKIIVIGDVMLDVYHECDVSRLSPEAPVPIAKIKETKLTPGGAANSAANVASLGYPVVLLGVVGPHGDAVSDQFKIDLSEKFGVNCVFARSGAGMIVKSRVASGTQQMIRIDAEADIVSAEAELIQILDANIDETTLAIIVVDHGKGAMTAEVIRKLLWKSGRLDKPVFVDAVPSQIPHYENVTLIKPNQYQAEEVLLNNGKVHPIMATGDVIERAIYAATLISDLYNASSVVVTCGSHGAVGYNRTAPVTVATDAQQVFDVAGAGDTFLAALVCAFIDGVPFASAIYQANVAAGLAVSQLGVVRVTRDELRQRLYELGGWMTKSMSLSQLVEYTARQKREGKSIVLANGCFDLLHAGHLQLFQWAKEQGDILVVAYNTDESVTELKGPGRPVVPARLRGSHLSQYMSVDAAYCFDGDVEPLVRAIHPDVLVKGGEYVDTVPPGADYVQSIGGKVLFAEMLPGFSTTENIVKLAQQ